MNSLEGKILGVIGGMGPMATQLFYKMVIDNTDANCDQDHIDMIILSHASMPDRTKAIEEGRVEELLLKLEKDAEYLREGGAEAIAIPCNTSHVVLKTLQEKVQIPIINMIEEAVKEVSCKVAEGSKVAILGTDGTNRIGLYKEELEKKGFETYILSEDSQKKIMKIIYDGIKKGGEIAKGDFSYVGEELNRVGCACSILACTELSVYKDMRNLPDFYIDAMESLAKKSIDVCKKNL